MPIRFFTSILVCITAHAWTESSPIHLPEPTGPFSIGTTTLHFVDASRENTFTDDKGDKRELMVQIWYPALPADGAEPTFYAPVDNEEAFQAAFGRTAANPMGIKPADLDTYLRPLRTHSFENAPVSNAEKTYPVLIFSHGYGGFKTQNTAQVEELVSHGYIVAGVDHTYFAGVTVMPGDRVILFDAKMETKDQEKQNRQMTKNVAIWTRDVSFVADELEVLNRSDSGSPLSGRFDMNRLGIFGHSFGGATAGEACSTDARFKAGINMDGLPFGHALEKGVLDKPFLFMKAAREPVNKVALGFMGMTEEEYNIIMNRFFETAAAFPKMCHPGYMVTFQQMRHYNFTDFPHFAQLTPLSKLVVGDFDAQEGGRLINELTLAFFDKHLKGEDVVMPPQSILDHPLVTVEIHDGE